MQPPKKPRSRFTRTLAVIAAYLPLSFAYLAFSGQLSASDWRTASREPAGLAPDPATTPEAVVQVYSARAVSWRGWFGVHTWIAVKPRDAHEFTVHEVIGWRLARTGTAVVARNRPADAYWFGNRPELLADIRGPGVDDVIRKPVHIREILARITAIRRRAHEESGHTQIGALRIHMDGRDPEINGKPLPLPRRERRILEYLASNHGRRVTKTQVFNAIYGLFDEEVEENVVESHISKLRKKLREMLGFDPIDSKRFLGYRLVV